MEWLSALLWLAPFALAYMLFLVLVVFTPLGMLLCYLGALYLAFSTGHLFMGAFFVTLPAWCLWSKI